VEQFGVLAIGRVTEEGGVQDPVDLIGAVGDGANAMRAGKGEADAE
jgi:hypothetical protein